MTRKHYIIAGIVVAIAYLLQPFSLLLTQIFVAPKIYDMIDKMNQRKQIREMSNYNLDQDKFAKCMQDPSIQAKIEAEEKLGESLEVSGTPTTFIGKKDQSGNNIVLYKDPISGALPMSSVKQAIESSKDAQLSKNSIPFEGAHIYGSANAEIFLVEFTDMQCPFCKKFHPTAKQIVDESNGKIALIYKHFPLPFHENAMPLAITAECIGEQAGNDGFVNFVNSNFEKAN